MAAHADLQPIREAPEAEGQDFTAGTPVPSLGVGVLRRATGLPA
jgi:hypothetical protein